MRSAVSSARVGAVDPGDVVARARRGRRRRRGTRRRTPRRRTRRRSPRRRRRARRRRRGPRLPNVPTLRWSAGTVAADVTSTPPIRSSATAIRTSAATASGSSPPARRRRAGVVGRAGGSANIRPSSTAELAVGAEPRRRGGVSHSSRGSGKSVRRWQPRLSVRVPRPRRRRPRRRSACSSPPTTPATARRRRVDLAGDGVEHVGRGGQRRRRRGPRRRGATSPRGSSARWRASTTAPPAASAASGSTRSGSSHARSRPSRVPATTLSVRLLDASRLAPCTPVHATSPTAYSPASAVVPSRPAGTPPQA